MPASTGLTTPPTLRYAAAFSMLVIVLGLLYGYAKDWRHWPYHIPEPVGQSARAALDGTGGAVVGWYVSLAAREAAGGPPTEVVGPLKLRTLLEGRGDPKLMERYHVLFSDKVFDQMTRKTRVKRDYDPRLSDDELARAEAGGDTTRYRKEVLAIRDPDDKTGAVVLHTDSTGRKVVVLSASLSPEGGAR